MARVTLFGDHHPHAHRLRLVGEQLQKCVMRNFTNSWLCFLPNSTLVFQNGFLPRTSVPIPSLTSSSMMRQLAVCRECITRRLRFVVIRVFAAGSEAGSLSFSKLFLPMLALLVVQLIDGLHRLPRDQAGHEARLIGGEGGKARSCQDQAPQTGQD